MWNWILHILGVLPRTPSSAYNFWSGFGSDLGEVAIIGGLIQIVRHQNCHTKSCWRLGHAVEGSPYRACHRHHPTHARQHRNVGVR